METDWVVAMDFDPRNVKTGDVVILGLPADDKSSYLRGAADAPRAIRAALLCPSSNLAAEDGSELSGLSATQDDSAVRDSGDLALGGRLDCEAIESAVASLLGRGALLLCLGGDHAVSFPILSAFPKGMSVLHIDAHPDLYEEFEGDRLSHACPFARAIEAGAVSRLVQVGIRGLNAAQRAQIERFRERIDIELIDMPSWASGLRPSFKGDFYLSLDLDGIDPAFAPGVSHREPGGLSSREVISLIQDCPGRLVGADLVELNPSRDFADLTAMLAAKLVKEIAARMLRDRRKDAAS